jgi:hypothetical protein
MVSQEPRLHEFCIRRLIISLSVPSMGVFGGREPRVFTAHFARGSRRELGRDARERLAEGGVVLRAI